MEIDTILAYKDSLKIVQDPNSFKFSIDSLILSFFVADSKKAKTICDFGCGSGVISLYMSMLTNAHIVGIDIDEGQLEYARKSVSINNLSDRIEITKLDIKDSPKELFSRNIDMIISNPPYFRVNNESFLNKEENLKNSRHETTLSLEELIESASKTLKDSKRFVFCHRTDRLEEIIYLLKKHSLQIRRMRFVYSKEDKDSYLVLFETAKTKKETQLKLLPPLYIYTKDGEYTDEIRGYFHYKENE